MITFWPISCYAVKTLTGCNLSVVVGLMCGLLLVVLESCEIDEYDPSYILFVVHEQRKLLGSPHKQSCPISCSSLFLLI